MKINLTFLVLLTAFQLFGQDITLVPFESTWKYLDNGTNQSVAWQQATFDDSGWASGQAMLGYGDSGVNTAVSYGNDPDDKHITTYFRHYFMIDDLSLFKNFLLKLKKDDAAIIYINGQEVMRSNFNEGFISYTKEAYSTISGEEEDIIWEDLIAPSFFVSGENVIAAEVHQRDSESSDLIFDLELIGLDSNPSLYRSPYLQKATPNGISIKWKTDIPTDSKVWYGADLANLSSVVTSTDLTLNHEVRIEGLTPNTNYFYKIGNSQTEFAGGTDEYFFTTLPEFGTINPLRIWVTGDAGTGKDEQIFTRNAYLNYIGQDDKADLWLMLGDNAYEHGREADYHMGLFSVYQSILRNTVSFPAAGNHDLLGGASADTETGTYYDIFDLPKSGESGGLPSNKESYYSIDYGNVHIVCLESYDLDRDSTGEMATWLKNDLQNTNADWLIAYWHFPPYSKVSHDTDDPDDFGGRSTEMRRHINPILEQYGIDLVLSGHSHGYERSFLIDGHYGFSNSLTPEMILDGSSGNMNETGAYTKPEHLSSHQGTVYVVCGSSGKLSSPLDDGPHAAMYETNTNFSGSLIIDIEDNVLEGKFLNEQGIIQDYFHIKKEGTNSIETIEKSSIFEIFPNPTSHIVKVKFKQQIPQDVNLKIYAADGRLIKSIDIDGNLPDNILSINLTGITKGVYTLKINQHEKHLESKMLIVR